MPIEKTITRKEFENLPEKEKRKIYLEQWQNGIDQKRSGWGNTPNVQNISE